MVSLSSKSKLPVVSVLLVINLSCQVVTIAALAAQGLAIHRLGRQTPPTLVQTHSGLALRVRPVDAAARTPATVKYFIASMMTTLFNWSGKLPTADDDTARDPGIDIKTASGTKKVPTAAWGASLALSADFRLPFLAQVADYVPAGVFRGQEQVVMAIDQISEPEPLAEGRWKVTVLAHLNVFNQSLTPTQTIPFHREIIVEAVNAPIVPEGETPLEQAVYTIRQAGLQITSIREIKDKG